MADWLAVGRRIRALRQEQGWSQREAARQSQTNHKIWSLVERGLAPAVSAQTIARMARALGVTVNYVLYGREGE